MAQQLKPNRSDNRGGSREGAGRKPEGRTVYGRRVSPQERIEIDKLIFQLRNPLA